MSVVDLTRYIVDSSGTWLDPGREGHAGNLFHFTRADTCSPSKLMLRWAGDFVALTGPLSVRVTVQAENMTVPLALVGNLAQAYAGAVREAADATAHAEIRAPAELDEGALSRFGRGRAMSLQASTIYSYTLDIQGGSAWPLSLSEALDAMRLQGFAGMRYEQLGNNLGYRILIEPAFPVTRLLPVTRGSDLPCDYAVGDQPNVTSFFPVACEPCNSSVIGMPPCEGVTLVTPPADGGCVRTRFFNGMFITREDLETEQRFIRLKMKLHNRAAGQGVVWGFAIGQEGSHICVAPGYGVDCCGNDLTLTTVYRVESAALLADPAAAAFARQRGPHRMHLLLEYVECPTDPRPVHGDPCTPDASRCEMSRIRESVRLRLVPPCDFDVKGTSRPIHAFLEEVSSLRARYPLNPADASAYERTPFQISMTTTSGKTSQTTTVRPGIQATTRKVEKSGRIETVSIEVTPDPMWRMLQGVVSGAVTTGQTAPANAAGGAKGAGAANPASAVDPAQPVTLGEGTSTKLVFTLPTDTQGGGEITYKIAGWRTQTAFADEEDASPAGDLTMAVRFDSNRALVEHTITTSLKIERPPLELRPCSGEPCTPGFYGGSADADCVGFRGAGAEPVRSDPTPYLPFLHADPSKPEHAGDPKALVLAALGGWLAQLLVRERSGTSSETLTSRRVLAETIFRYAWLMLFGVSAKAEPYLLYGPIKRLFEKWCDGLLYRGPECCGDLHGVVIGCCVVEGGAIHGVDPWGGRRYVMHYPLLEHWGEQFGIAPPDLALSRLFSKICCLATLGSSGGRPGDVGHHMVSIGHGYLMFGQPESIATTLNGDATIVAQRKVGLPEMLASVVTLASGAQGGGAQGGGTHEAIILNDLVSDRSVVLAMPVT
jgi:hypothetical protein